MPLPTRLKDQSLIDDADNYLSDRSNFHLWWLGQSGYLLQWNGKRILLDPYLSDSLTTKYASTAKPHVRMSERVIDPRLLTGISIVTSSHNHTDHLDAETLVPVLKNNKDIRFLIPEANRDFVAARIRCARGFPLGISDRSTVTIGDFTFTGIPAKHNEIERDENGDLKFMGYVIQFGRWSVYHSGDTLWFDEMVDRLKPFAIDLALLPINGNLPHREVAGNLNAQEAALLAKAITARMVIPCHYDMFEFNTADTADFVKEAEKIGQPFTILAGGEHWDSSSLVSNIS